MYPLNTKLPEISMSPVARMMPQFPELNGGLMPAQLDPDDWPATEPVIETICDPPVLLLITRLSGFALVPENVTLAESIVVVGGLEQWVDDPSSHCRRRWCPGFTFSVHAYDRAVDDRIDRDVPDAPFWFTWVP